MGREILFRGKRIDNGEWVEGFYSQFHNRPAVPEENSHQIFEPREDAYFCGSAIGGLWHLVAPSTVGQYTGMKDKSGKRIFEGDIVAFTRENALGYTTSRIGEVKYFVELPVFYIMATTGDAWDWYQCQELQIIGNVHDHPELLKGGAPKWNA